MRILFGAILALVILVTGYVFWWNHVADRLLAEAEKWRAARIAEGYEITHKPLYASGFPYRVAVTAEDLAIANPGHVRTPRLEVPRFWALVQPWRFNHVIYGIDGPGRLSWQEEGAPREVSFNAASFLGSAIFNRQGRMRSGAIDIHELKAFPSWREPLSAARVQLHGRPHPIAAEARPTADPGQQIVLRIDELFVDGLEDFPLRPRIGHVAVSTTLHGTIPRLPAEETLREWRGNGGYVDIEALRMEWGPGTLDGAGQLTLDEQLRPEGTIETRIAGYREILTALVTAGQISPDAGRTIGYGIDLLAQQDENGNLFIRLPLRAEGGALYLGPVYLLPLPHVTGRD